MTESESLHPFISLIIPFWNPGKYFIDHIGAVTLALRRSGVTFEIIAVNDGSNDGSYELLLEHLEAEVRTIKLETNLGKGAALEKGFNASIGEWIGFIDADGDLPASQLTNYIELITESENKFDAVIASKLMSGSVIHASLLRKLSSSIYHHLVKVLFSLEISDTQTGLKFFSREVIDEVLPLAQERGFVFDLELLVLMRLKGYGEIIELPATILKRQTSTVSFKSALLIFRDTLKLWNRLKNVSL